MLVVLKIICGGAKDVKSIITSFITDVQEGILAHLKANQNGMTMQDMKEFHIFYKYFDDVVHKINKTDTKDVNETAAVAKKLIPILAKENTKLQESLLTEFIKVDNNYQTQKEEIDKCMKQCLQNVLNPKI